MSGAAYNSNDIASPGQLSIIAKIDGEVEVNLAPAGE